MTKRTIDFQRLCVIKTGWSESYRGEEPRGDYSWLSDGGEGVEAFNMLPTADGYEVYSLRIGDRAPRPAPLDGWTVVHVARDPALKSGAMKIVGWYEDAKFLLDYKQRSGSENGTFNIHAARAFLFRPVDRPAIAHGKQFGSGNVFWLAGNDASTTDTDWSKVRRRIVAAIDQAQSKAEEPSSLSDEKLPGWLGSTITPLAQTNGLQTDDGGEVYGRSGGESAEHRDLREWAQRNPKRFLSNKDVLASHTEYPLPSGDWVDAAHIAEDEIVLIEAKSRRSGEKDVLRGIFQCIKYRAVQLAERRDASPKVTVRAILLTEKPISERLQILANRHQIELMVKRVKAD